MSSDNKTPKIGDLLRSLIFRRYGVSGLLVLALASSAFFVWTQWDKVRTWPGVPFIVSYLEREALPKADPHRFSVAVAHLEGDVNREHERLIVRLLKDFEGIQVLTFDRTISTKGPVPEEREREGHQSARDYLKESKASVLIWGSVLSFGGQTKPDLYLTAARGEPGKSKQYTPEVGTEFRLPKVFWEDLSDVLRLLIITRDAEFRTEEGRYVADRLRPFIARVRNLLDGSTDRPGWNPEALASTHVIFAGALLTYGKQAGENEELEDAIKAYKMALSVYTRDRAPLDWAATQNNLGIALSTLGKREAGTAHLEEAVGLSWPPFGPGV